MPDKHYIDTSSQDSQFSMPNIGVDYRQWLLKKYETASTVMDGRPAFHGVAQRINQLIFEARKNNHTLVAFGPHAKEVAKVIQELANNSINVEVAK